MPLRCGYLQFPIKPLLLALALLSGAHVAQAQQAATAVTAVLAGHAALPTDTTTPAPRDAGAFFATAGKFANNARARNEKLGSEPSFTTAGGSKPRATGGALPVKGQAVQGFSGIVALNRDDYLVLTDNGFGSKINSQDALLMVHTVHADWKSGKVTLRKTVFLHDPDRKAPFAIQNEATDKRYLTGVDFDVESIQKIGNTLWIGDEFGPYILQVDLSGKVLGVSETVVNGKNFRSPDHYMNGRLPNLPSDAMPQWEVRRSGGFEPMAKSPDGKTLYPAFEWPLYDAQTKTFEKINDRIYTHILEFDVASRRYTGKEWKYAFEENGNVMADFQMLDATTGLVIERDDASEGMAPACAGEERPDCFARPAKFKRVYKIDLSSIDANGFVRKVAYIDLLKIANPARLAKRGPNEEVFSLPHLGPEGLAIVDATHIVVVNDNNYPGSSGRQLGKPDDDEITLLDIKALLDVK